MMNNTLSVTWTRTGALNGHTCVCVCVCVCVRACVRVLPRLHMCMLACACVHACVRIGRYVQVDQC